MRCELLGFDGGAEVDGRGRGPACVAGGEGGVSVHLMGLMGALMFPVGRMGAWRWGGGGEGRGWRVRICLGSPYRISTMSEEGSCVGMMKVSTGHWSSEH